jgi:hypothetical protein
VIETVLNIFACYFVLQLSNLTQKLPSKASYGMKDKGTDGNERRRGRKRKKLLDDLKDKRGYSHLK